jgi:FtsX extracellular domain/Sigma-70 region 2
VELVRWEAGSFDGVEPCLSGTRTLSEAANGSAPRLCDVEVELLSHGEPLTRDRVDVATLFAEHHLGLVRLALLMVGDQATAEDVVQEAFARTHAGRRRLRDLERTLTYFLCKTEYDPFPQCKGQKADKAEIAEALWSRPDVEWLRFESAAKAYRNFREQNKDNSVILTAVKVKDMPEVFRILPEQGADWDAIIAAAKSLPGVSNVIDQRCLTRKEGC